MSGDRFHVEFGVDDKVASVASGKEFSLMVTDQVADLSGHVVTAVAACKAHIVVLTNNHEVFTFGMNNKGKCGSEFPGGPGACRWSVRRPRGS